jgi:hypothetical protein
MDRRIGHFPLRRPGFDPRWSNVGFMATKVALWWGFLRVMWFLLPILIPPTAPYSLISLSSTFCSLDIDNVVR